MSNPMPTPKQSAEVSTGPTSVTAIKAALAHIASACHEDEAINQNGHIDRAIALLHEAINKAAQDRSARMKIVTNHDFPPIPDRRWDWSAIDSNTYDGADDSSNRNQVGHGATEQEAIDNLMEILAQQ